MLQINTERLVASLLELGTHGALPGGGVNRLALTDADRAGRDWTVAQMRALGMQVEIDAIGNGIATYAGSEDLPPVMCGSHIDTVRTGGLYDGNLGVLAGLEVVRTLKDAGVRPRRPIAVAFFTNEEGSRFQPDMLGSLVYVGGLPLAEALAAPAVDGPLLGDELARIGYAGSAPVGQPVVDSYFELHIEQGPVLDQQGIQIGVVEGVQGIYWTRLVFTGKSNHAGTTPMALRADAGMAAMRTAAFAHQLAEQTGGRQLATVGSLELVPNLVNVIAAQARMTVDLRNTDAAALAQVRAQLHAFAAQCAQEHGVQLEAETLADFDPVAFDPALVDSVEQHARAAGCSTLRLPSGAGHDAQMLARVCPTAMIFVPSIDGLSHNVREYTPPADIGRGAQILLQVMLERANR
ncbi:Zn-dependent hydrolase [Corticibacter populi]|uniref:Zn-dependent hydrolase n=1 Tax=Corticibacter populi TaxID=1550736 RepID=A0A3M6R0D5_9BURK|nr:Zn-dependent hydrolase [Corticibacter populi]RMX08665.1 Zn-dependent hydrolase [Corticibacter populi]RZS36002.1 N-carbamoyl-L-amino-acid hydrolase [Corticibacter populi]